MKKLTLVFLTIFMLSAVSAQAARKNHEKYYQDLWCTEQGGEIEFVLDDKTRVDCLLKQHAVEFDFADKWAESFGQATYYGKKTKRQPGIVLIVEDDTKDMKYVIRLMQIVNPYYGLWLIFPDGSTQEIGLDDRL